MKLLTKKCFSCCLMSYVYNVTRKKNYLFHFIFMKHSIPFLSTCPMIVCCVQPCNCNMYGSQTPDCDPRSGQCVCKPKYVGRTCGQCKDGFGNIRLVDET